MKVLAASDSSGEGSLRTCALRLAGVYGPGEERHMPRIVVSPILMVSPINVVSPIIEVKGKRYFLYTSHRSRVGV